MSREILKSNVRIISAIFLLITFLNNENVLSQSNYQTNDPASVVISDSTGIYVSKNNFNPKKLFPKKKWRGDWIWLNKNEYHNYQETFTTWINNKENRNKKYRALFRKKISLGRVPSLTILNITGDVSYRAYLNGKLVCQGPPNIGSDYEDKTPPRHWYFTSHNIKDKLETGDNILAVEVFSFNFVLDETTSGCGKFICNIDSSDNQTFLFTDTTWKCKLDTSYTIINNILAFANNTGPGSWTNEKFDDNNWFNASIEDADIYTYLEQSKIPAPVKVQIKPQNIFKDDNKRESITNLEELYSSKFFNDKFTLDFGRNISGFYSFSVNASKNDTVKIYPSEKSNINRPFIFICKEGENNYSIPYLNVFRYLTFKIVSKNGLKFNSVKVQYSSYPVKYAGEFSCSNSFYTKLWKIVRWTTQMCMQSLYLDSPLHQEPLACTGDYLIESLSNFYAFGDPWLVRQDLIKTAKIMRKNNYDMFHTSYSLLWVQMLNNYYRYTEDTALVKELINDVNRLNKLFETYLGSNYLLSQAPDYMFMDWIKIDKFNAHHPPPVIGMGYLTAFYYKSLIDAANLNRIAGNNLNAISDMELGKKIKNSINTFLWDKEKGLYKDGIPNLSKVKSNFWLPKDEDIKTYSPHINSLTVLYDIAPTDKIESIMNYVLSEKEIELQPYFTYFVLSAVEHTGNFDTQGLELIDKWKNGIDLETNTLKENWNDETEFGYKGDYSHAWGGSPLSFISRNILGISPGLPGYKKIRFEPYAGEKISWAKGEVPLNPEESVCVEFERKSNLEYAYKIDIPVNFETELIIPQNLKNFVLIINGKKIDTNKNEIKLTSGNYKIMFIANIK